MKFIQNERHLLKLSHFSKGRKKIFVKLQELVRKDIEQAFSVLQARFAFICGPTHLIKEEEIVLIMKAYVKLYDMTIEDKRDNYKLAFDSDVVEGATPQMIINHDHHPCYETCFQRLKEICDPVHMQLSK